MDRIFDDAWRGVGVPMGDVQATWAAPRVDVSEDERNVYVMAELPGLREEDVEVTFNDGMFRIAGEKRAEHEDAGRQYYISERTYGRLERSLPINWDIEDEHIEAAFRDGVLTVTLPKAKAGESVRKIDVKRAA